LEDECLGLSLRPLLRTSGAWGTRRASAKKPTILKGGKMKGKFRTILILLVGLLALCTVTKAEGRDAIKLAVPFEFVVDGETLPAGTYTLRRLGDDKFEGLILRNETTGTSVFVHPIEIENASSDMPRVSFERFGEEHFLSKIQTSHDVYEIVARSETLETTARAHQARPTSASSEGK